MRYKSDMAVERYLGVDLAWRADGPGRPANETGVALLDANGRILDAGWTRGLEETTAWITTAAGDGPAVAFVDASLVVTNTDGQRPCETQVGHRYGRWKVSANSTNLGSPRLAGVTLRAALEARGWRYDDGRDGPPRDGRVVSECYPYTTLVGAFELGYDRERPRYKRKPKGLRAARWRPERAVACDGLIGRVERLATADPPLILDSHPVTRQLVAEPSPLGDAAYKHREDLIDALLCAWTAALWCRHGTGRCQVLGPPAAADGDPAAVDDDPAAVDDDPAATGGGPVATIIAPARPEQR